MREIKEILDRAIEQKASDVHLNVGMPPVMRKNTELVSMVFPLITDEDIKRMLLDLVGAKRYNFLIEQKHLDFSITTDGGCRFRCNAHFQRSTIAISFRLIPEKIPAFDDLHLPSIIKQLTQMTRGLILITGHAGSGKSTTLASVIDQINLQYKKRIITLEDPIEYVFTNSASMIEQRELGADFLEFAPALKYILRQDPDIIAVGEMRDLETTSSTITAAETGHLVFSTLHTISASQAIERIVDIYPTGQKNQMRTILANTLQCVITQTLFKRIDAPGMIPAIEILICTPAVRNCIRENKICEIPNIIETSSKIGMQSMDHSICQLYAAGFIGRDEAVGRSANRDKMIKYLLNNNIS